MRHHPLSRYGLLLVLVAFAAPAREPNGKVTIRTLQVSEHPSKESEPVYVAGQVATVLRFEQEVDPARTTLLAWEGRFEPPLVGGRMVVLELIRDLHEDEATPLRVTLVDGTEFAFLVKRPSREDWGWIDHQVNVFRDPGGYNAVLSSLYDSLKREHDLSTENERLKKEENSVDHAFATLLMNGQVSKTPFRRVRLFHPKNEDMELTVELLSGPGRAAALITLKNIYYGGPWVFEDAYLTRDFTSYTARPSLFAWTGMRLFPASLAQPPDIPWGWSSPGSRDHGAHAPSEIERSFMFELTPPSPGAIIILAAALSGCTTVSGVALRADGSPGPQECSDEAKKTMRILRMHVGDSALVYLDANQIANRHVTLYDGPIESVMKEGIGAIESPARLYGQVWTSGPQVVIRYYEAHPADGDKVSICAVARLSDDQLQRLPESKPGTAIIEGSVAAAFIVDAFR